MLKKLPIGIQTSEEIITKNYLYIDKTKEAYTLIESGTIFYLLSRPRRFGKSLFIDTLQDIFEGKKELFQDLYIYNKWNWDINYNTFISIFASIPHNNYTKNNIQNYEGFYASVIHLYLQSLGVDIIGEDVTNQGRIDLTIKIDNFIYIIEFKMGNRDALNQIKKKKNISKFEWEIVGCCPMTTLIIKG